MTTRDDLTAFLASTDYFRDLSAADVAALAAEMTVLTVSEGQLVFDEGDPGDGWYLIVSGEVMIARRSDEKPPHTLAHLEAGEGFGEMSLLEDAPRMAEARAVEDTTLARLPRETFHGLLSGNHPGAALLLRQMATALCQRLREVTAILQDIVDNPAPSAPDHSALDNLIRAVMAQN